MTMVLHSISFAPVEGRLRSMSESGLDRLDLCEEDARGAHKRKKDTRTLSKVGNDEER